MALLLISFYCNELFRSGIFAIIAKVLFSNIVGVISLGFIIAGLT